jgi:SAM-dependent methyltransferase
VPRGPRETAAPATPANPASAAPANPASAATDGAILAELCRLAVEHPGYGLLQFRSLLGARQYGPLYRLCRRYVPPRAAVLDWGAGNGHFSYFLLRAGYRAHGFSIADEGPLDWLRDLGYERTRGDPGEPVRIPFADDAFDAVTSVGVLEHVRETAGDERASLREIARVLRPGGVFLCYHFPNRYSWIDGVSRLVPGKHHHLFRFTRADIGALSAGAGLALVEARRYGILPRNIGHRLPGPLRGSAALARGWDALDAAMAIPLSPVCQNYYFVARKPDRDRFVAIEPDGTEVARPEAAG